MVLSTLAGTMTRVASEILIIEPSFGVREILKQHIRLAPGALFLEAQTGQQALNILFPATLPSPRLQFIISEFNLTDLTGIELYRRIRLHPVLKGIPFLLLIQDTEQHRLSDILRAGITHYLVKPFTEHELTDQIQRLT
jgi:two-component system, chemotaxis family, chemotaxis protein CheY